MKSGLIFSGAIGILIAFAAICSGAHNIWAATLFHSSVLFLTAALLLTRALNKNSEPLRAPLWLSALAVVAVFFLSWTGSVVPSESLIALKDWISAFLLFYVALNVLTEDRFLRVLTGMVVPAFWYQAVFSLIQTFHSFHTGSRWLEIQSTLVNANFQAGFCLFWFPILLELSMEAWRARRQIKWFWIAGFVAIACTFLVSGSTWGWMVLIFLLLWRYRASYYSNRQVMIRVGLATLAILLVKFVFMGGSNQRLIWWETALRMTADRPWFGIGIGNFPSAFLWYKARAVTNTLYAHSILFELLAETGVIGILAVGVFGWLFWRRLRMLPPLGPERRALLLGVSSVLIFTLMSLGFEYVAHLACLGVFLGSTAVVMEGPSFRPRLSVAILFAGSVMVTTPYLISPFLASRHLVTGASYLNEGQRDSANKHFQLALEFDPTAWEAWQGRALASYGQFQATGDKTHLSAAVEYQQQAIRFNQKSKLLRKELEIYSKDL